MAAALILLALLAYWPALHNKYVWDDDEYVRTQTALRNTDGLERIWTDTHAAPQYYPMVSTLFWVQYQLWTLDWAGYHLVNILLHGLNAVLLWLALRRLKVPGGWLAAAVFAVHPVHVESVAWITELKNVLSALFALLTLLVYLRFDPGLVEENPLPKRWRLYPLVLVLFAAALLSKSAVAPFALGFGLLVWWKRGRIGLADLAAVIPLVVLAAGSGLVTLLVERGTVGVGGTAWAVSWPLRFAQAGLAVSFYAWKLLCPAGLSFIYPRWNLSHYRWLGWGLLAGWMAGALLLWAMRCRIGRGPVTAVLLFGGLLVPAAGFFNVFYFRYSFVADHFQYFASVALIVPVCAAGAVLWSRLRRRSFRITLGVGLAAVVLTLALLTNHRCKAFYDNETIWRDSIRANSQAFMAMNNLAAILIERKEYDQAMVLLNRAIEIKPDFFYALDNRGWIYGVQGHLNLAEADFQAALRYNPRYSLAHNNLGILHGLTGKPGDREQAIVDFDNAIRCNKRFAAAYGNRAAANYRLGHVTEAMADIQTCLRLGGSPNPALLNELRRLRLGGSSF